MRLTSPRLRPARLLTVAVMFAVLSSAELSAQRSFVGKSLTGITFEDTEGHTIDPAHYRGSVLVMISGIPW